MKFFFVLLRDAQIWCFFSQCHFNLLLTLFGDPTRPEQQVTTHKLKLIEFHSTCCEDKVLSPQLGFFCI